MNIEDKESPCCMTVLLNDYAYPKEREYLLPFFHVDKPLPARKVSIYSKMTLDTLRVLSNEQIGEFVRKMLNKLDEDKNRIEG
jgi:hypothetical protein